MAATYGYIDAVWAGTEDPAWLHVALISASVLAVIAAGAGIVFGSRKYSAKIHRVAFWLVVAGVAVEFLCMLLLFVVDDRVSATQRSKIAELNGKAAAAEGAAAGAAKKASDAITRTADLEAKAAALNKEAAELRARTAERLWTKEQFDAIQDIKGVVTDVGILWAARCVECQDFGTQIEAALHSAGAKIYGAHGSDQTFASSTGIMVWLPAEADLQKDPLIEALDKAGLSPLVTHHLPTESSKTRTDIPVIFVGERVQPTPSFPSSPPSQQTWTILPIEKQ